ncbi:MAG: S-adenosylmethionine:tRNA ribosyltransferase-isomerase [Muribaculaceae bacterium]|nr:S-adenosylmethionine:tRNA ribosyltransferase-isomerase [Muribaculaceae bacterium]
MMTDIKNIRIADFDYDLPDEKIPRHPLRERDSCKLLVSRPDGSIGHCVFSDLPQLLPEDSILVCNDTRVINARIRFEKLTGSKIEVFLLEPISPADYVLMFQAVGSCRWGCLVGNLKRWKEGPLTKELKIGDKTVVLTAHRGKALEGNAREITFEWNDPEMTFASVVEAAGYIPIPPYLKRDSEATDSEDYQTVYARVQGSVAAPTAGLHFTPELFERLRGAGVDVVPLTLHVGAGTFQPVKSDTIGEHPMHTEVFSVDKTSLKRIIDAKKMGSKITAVGTTSVRTLESLPYLGAELLAGIETLHVDQWQPYGADTRLSGNGIAELKALLNYMEERGVETLTASTSIMIAPGFTWRVVDSMVTNFHQPQSTLLLLVSSFLDKDKGERTGRWRDIYKEALEKGYRFLSYGDACLFV